MKEDLGWDGSEGAGGVGERLFQEWKWSTAGRYANRADPSGYKVLNTSMCGWKWQRACNSWFAGARPGGLRQRSIYCFSFAGFCQPGVGTSVRMAAEVSCSSTFEKFSFLSELGRRLKLAK